MVASVTASVADDNPLRGGMLAGLTTPTSSNRSVSKAASFRHTLASVLFYLVCVFPHTYHSINIHFEKYGENFCYSRRNNFKIFYFKKQAELNNV